jgi:hypothetical protein
MTLGEIIYNAKNLLNKGQSTDDFNLSDRQWSFIVNYYRAKLVKQQLQKGKLSDKFKQRTVIDYNPTTGAFDLPSDVIEDGITYVGTHERQFTQVSFNARPFRKYAKVTSNWPRWYRAPKAIRLDNENSRVVKKLRVEGVFENPKLVAECDNPKCGLDFEYPLPLNYVDTIVKLIAETELRVLTSIPGDTQNDGLNQLEQIQGV